MKADFQVKRDNKLSDFVEEVTKQKLNTRSVQMIEQNDNGTTFRISDTGERRKEIRTYKPVERHYGWTREECPSKVVRLDWEPYKAVWDRFMFVSTTRQENVKSFAFHSPTGVWGKQVYVDVGTGQIMQVSEHEYTYGGDTNAPNYSFGGFYVGSSYGHSTPVGFEPNPYRETEGVLLNTEEEIFRYLLAKP